MLESLVKSLKPAWLADLRRCYRNHRWEETESGFLVGSNEIRGDLVVTANDGLGALAERNLLTTEGKAHIWNVILGSTAKISTWYVAIASGNVSYSATWTGANFASNATELTTQYSEATRVEYVEASTSTAAITNSASPAVFTGDAGGVPITVWGAGLLSLATKGGTSGTLLAASKYTTARSIVEAGDTLSIAWTLTLT